MSLSSSLDAHDKPLVVNAQPENSTGSGNSSWIQATILLRSTLSRAGIGISGLVTPIMLSFAASLCEGLSMALLIPMIQTLLMGTVPETISTRISSLLGPSLTHWCLGSPLKLGLILIALTFLSVMGKIATAYLSALLTTKQIKRFAHNLRVMLFERYLSFGKAFYDCNSIGSHQQVLTTYINSVSLSLNSMQGALYAVCTAIVYFVILVFTSWQLTVVVICALPLLQIGLRRLIRRIENSSHAYLQSLDEIGRKIANSLTTIPLVKATANEEAELKEFARISDLVSRLDYSIEKKALLVSPLQEALMMCVMLALVVMIGFINAQLGVAAAASSMVYLLVLKRLVSIVGMANGIKGAIASTAGPISEILSVLDDSEKYRVTDGVRTCLPITQKIEFNNLSFAYPNGVQALDSVSFSMLKGKVTALVGSSGAGKSTIAQLLMRFYDDYQGEILIDDIELSDIRLASWLERVAWVSQETLILHDSLRHNLTYGLNRDVSDREMSEVICRSQLQSVVGRLDKGLDTNIGERGVRLSGGERQRIAIARAILRRAEVLILDEATSSLDSETENHVQAALTELTKGRTTLVIAHRLATIKLADEIVVLEGGKVVERGGPETLTARGTRFQQLWEAQYGRI